MKKAGFTIIEMIVVIAVSSLLIATLISYKRNAGRQIILFREQAKLLGILSRARALAIEVFFQDGVNVPCGYGVFFSPPRSYRIFQDLTVALDDCSLADSAFTGDPNDPNNPELFEAFELDPAVEFGSITLTEIIFIPPDPIVIITPVQNQATIAIRLVGGSNSVSLKVNSVGQISVQ